MSASLQESIQSVSNEYRQLQTTYSAAVEARQRLDAQKSENESVQKEFSNLTPNNIIYKQLGPVLLKQDPVEARANVDKRLEFIASEIIRVEAQLEDLSTKMESRKNKLMNLQTQLQQDQSGAMKAASVVA